MFGRSYTIIDMVGNVPVFEVKECERRTFYTSLSLLDGFIDVKSGLIFVLTGGLSTPWIFLVFFQGLIVYKYAPSLRIG
jgi:hypothetical protein